MHSLIMDLTTAQYRGLYTMWHGYLMLRFLCVATKNCVDTGHAAACAGQMVTRICHLVQMFYLTQSKENSEGSEKSVDSRATLSCTVPSTDRYY